MKTQLIDVNNTTHFNPEVDYYFISMHIGNSLLPKWYRKPFMTKEMVTEFLTNEFISNHEDIEKIEIFEEKTLLQKIYLKGNDGDFYETNLREFLFGKNYSVDSEYYSRITTPGAEFTWRKFK